MQTAICHSSEDAYLIAHVDHKGRSARKSYSAVILESYFESDKKLGEILLGLGLATPSVAGEALALQQSEGVEKRLGEILVERELVQREGTERALMIQQRAGSYA